jgi:predicted nuclease of predicted toxin-antitoxin system
MKVLVDENIPLITVEELRLKGFDVIDIRGGADQGITDEVLWQKAQQEKRILITTDKGFSINRDEAHHGILYSASKHINLVIRTNNRGKKYYFFKWKRFCMLPFIRIRVVALDGICDHGDQVISAFCLEIFPFF